MNPSETTGKFTSGNGVSVFYRCRLAANERARLVLSHGLGEHSGRYDHVIDCLTGQGISVWAIDHQGHGQSGGSRGHIDRFDQYLTDLKQVVDMAKTKKPEA